MTDDGLVVLQFGNAINTWLDECKEPVQWLHTSSLVAEAPVSGMLTTLSSSSSSTAADTCYNIVCQ
jgi:hypothetical protein